MGYDARPGSIHVIFNGGTDDMDHASQLQPVSLARDLSKGLLEGKEKYLVAMLSSIMS